MKKMNVLPFYMTYPTVAYTKENGMVEDLEYFQQMARIMRNLKKQ